MAQWVLLVVYQHKSSRAGTFGALQMEFLSSLAAFSSFLYGTGKKSLIELMEYINFANLKYYNIIYITLLLPCICAAIMCAFFSFWRKQLGGKGEKAGSVSLWGNT